MICFDKTLFLFYFDDLHVRFRLTYRPMTCWLSLIHNLTDWPTNWQTDQLTDWLTDWLTNCGQASLLLSQPTDCQLKDALKGRWTMSTCGVILIRWLGGHSGWLAWLTDRPTNRLTAPTEKISWPIECIWLSMHGPINVLNDRWTSTEWLDSVTQRWLARHQLTWLTDWLTNRLRASTD